MRYEFVCRGGGIFHQNWLITFAISAAFIYHSAHSNGNRYFLCHSKQSQRENNTAVQKA